MRKPQQHRFFYGGIAGLATLFLMHCASSDPTSQLTAPATQNAAQDARQRQISFSADIYTTEADFALQQHQMLVLPVEATAQPLRLAADSGSTDYTLCLSEAAQTLLQVEGQSTSCFDISATQPPVLNIKALSAQKGVVFVRYAAANRQWTLNTSSCTDCNLKGLSLENYVFSGVDLSRADFSDARLKGAMFQNSNLTNARFDGGKLQNTNFDGALMTQTSLRRTDLTGTDLEGARKLDVRLDGATGLSES